MLNNIQREEINKVVLYNYGGENKMEKIKLYQRILDRHMKDVNMKTGKNWRIKFFPVEVEKQRENTAEIVSNDGEVVLNGTYLELYFYILRYKHCFFELANNLLIL